MFRYGRICQEGLKIKKNVQNIICNIKNCLI